MKLHRIIAIVIFFAVLVFAVMNCAKFSKKRNILLITVDTLRPDHLGCYGNTLGITPNIDELAKEGVLFENAYSQAGWTLPSLASILTGAYPKDHGATDFHWGLNKHIPTMAGILKERGYHTHAFVSHIILTPKYGLNRGFEEYDYSVLNYGPPHNTSTAKQLTDLALIDLKNIEEPFLLWIHYFDPHFKYLSHKGWEFLGDSDVNRYDQEIGFTDSNIGRLLDYLKERGLDDNTIIIFTADHGEEFLEHGGRFHYTCYNEVLRIPLIIKSPDLKPGREPIAAEQIDIMPTIFDLAQIEYSPELPGMNLFKKTEPAPPVFIERDRPPGFRQRAVIYDNYKLIRITNTDTTKIPVSSRGTYSVVRNVKEGNYIFNLGVDPRETENVFDQNSIQAEKLMGMLAMHLKGRIVRAEKIQVDENLKKELRSLGYIQ